MIQLEYLKEVMEQQLKAVSAKEKGLERDELSMLPDIKSHALIVSGIRRCGKSTLLFQLLGDRHAGAMYLNFDDPRLYNFDLGDFDRLDRMIRESGKEVLMFDEIQIIPGWERYVRQKLDENFQVIVTGSNASLLSKELGTSLTGRHITMELFPFSFNEFCRFRGLAKSAGMLANYLKEGGFPEYLKTGLDDVLTFLLDDILVRDIAVRYGIKDVRSLQRLTLFLINNIGNRVTGNKLKDIFGIASTTTILEYFSHLEQSYLLSFVPMFDYSIKKQNINPKKVYAIDTGLVEVNTPGFKKDDGHKLENLIYIALRRRSREVFYYNGKGECDFVILNRGVITEAVQVCYTLTNDNMDRELAGLFEAMRAFNLTEGTIVTLNQSDLFEKEGLVAHVVPAHEFV